MASSWLRVAAGAGVALLVVGAAVFVVLEGDSARLPDTGAAIDATARARIRELEEEVDLLRVAVARLHAQAERQAVVAHATEAPTQAASQLAGANAAEAAGKAATRVAAPPVAAADWLKRLFPDTFLELTAEEAQFLRTLDLSGKAITAEDLLLLAGLPRLGELTLGRDTVTEAALRNLNGLTTLRHLDLGGGAVTATGLQWLPADNLRSLHLQDASLRDEDLSALHRLAQLEKVKLDRTAVTDRGLAELGSCGSLRHVEIDQTSVTAAGVRELLRRNPNLRRIEVRNTAVTAADVAELLRDFPGKEIVVEQGFVLGLIR